MEGMGVLKIDENSGLKELIVNDQNLIAFVQVSLN
jgi:hypothetical protein|tara:strand:- start:17 stop:121 length:105 start_codon:yes stop_codon:yes gene_type:complete